jgi:sulfur-carrier protein
MAATLAGGTSVEGTRVAETGNFLFPEPQTETRILLSDNQRSHNNMTEAAKIKVHVPTLLRHYCDGAAELSLQASSVQAALEQIELSHPSLYSGICDETGKVRRHVNLFVNAAHIRDRQGVDTALVAGDVLTILPAVSGGCGCPEHAGFFCPPFFCLSTD